MRFIKIACLVAIALFALNIAVGINSAQELDTSLPSEQEERAFQLLNADRAKYGIAPLRFNTELAALARGHGQDMISRGFFSHTNPDDQSPYDRMDSAGIKFRFAGENLAMNDSVEAAQAALMNSEKHRKNILNRDFTEVGLGVCFGPDGSVYVVQVFTGN